MVVVLPVEGGEDHIPLIPLEHSLYLVNLWFEGLLDIPLFLLPSLCNYIERQGKETDSQTHRRQRDTAAVPQLIGKLEHQLNKEFYRIYENQV